MSQQQLTFKEYVNSIYAAKGKTGETPIALNEVERGTVASYIVQHSLIGTLGLDLPFAEASKSSATFIKNLAQDLKPKTTLGNGTFDKARFESVIVKWNEPYYESVGFMASDIALGLPNASALKLSAAAAKFSRLFERTAWAKIEEHALTLDNTEHKSLLDTKLSDLQVRKEIINLGTQLMKLKDEDDNIDGISKDQIVIHVKPEVLDRVASSGVLGNFAEQSFVGGQYSIGQVGGYQVYANPFLDKLDAIACSTFSTASRTAVIASNTGNISLTEDIGYYFEAMSLFKVIYPKCFKALKKDA